MKITKNNVSYFHAGVIAGLRFNGLSKEVIKELFYSDLKFMQHIAKYIQAYDKKKDAIDGEKELLKETYKHFYLVE